MRRSDREREMKSQKAFTVFLAWSVLSTQAVAQESLLVEKPKAPVVLRPYKAPTIPPVRLKNSDRLRSLIRAGKLYLTVQDVLALAIENNLDLEVDRYGPIVAEWQLERQQAGGPLRGDTGGNGAGAAVVSQIGPITPNLDPVLQNATLFSHTTIPQPNTIQSQTPALVDTRHIYNSVVQEGLLTGGFVQVSANESYLKENTPTDILNPSVVPVVQVFIRQNFLQGFGVGVK